MTLLNRLLRLIVDHNIADYMTGKRGRKNIILSRIISRIWVYEYSMLAHIELQIFLLKIKFCLDCCLLKWFAHVSIALLIFMGFATFF